MKKCLVLMMMLLVSCNGNSNSTKNSAISINPNEITNSISKSNDDEVIDDKTRFEASKSVWGFEMGIELQKAIGAD